MQVKIIEQTIQSEAAIVLTLDHVPTVEEKNELFDIDDSIILELCYTGTKKN